MRTPPALAGGVSLWGANWIENGEIQSFAPFNDLGPRFGNSTDPPEGPVISRRAIGPTYTDTG